MTLDVDAAKLLRQTRARLSVLSQSLPVAVDPLAIEPRTRSKAPYLALCFREAQAWRFEEFARAACDMFERSDNVVAVANTRCASESLAALYYLRKLIADEVDRGTAADDIYDRLRQLHLGSRSEDLLPKAINVLTMLKQIDAEIPGFYRNYELMCEFGHPNYSGSAGAYGSPDHETLITHFGRNIRGGAYPQGLGMNCLAGGLGLFIHYYNEIGDLIGAFSEACERGLPPASGATPR